MADWDAIRTEYITNPETSYRKLAGKYGIHYKVISARGKAEKWLELRAQHKDKLLTKTLDKISREQADLEAARAVKLHTVADKLLLRIEAMVDAEEPLDTKAIRAIASAIKDLKEVQGVHSSLDRMEQEARIANLRRSAEADKDKAGEVKVVFDAGEDSWNE